MGLEHVTAQYSTLSPHRSVQDKVYGGGSRIKGPRTELLLATLAQRRSKSVSPKPINRSDIRDQLVVEGSTGELSAASSCHPGPDRAGSTIDPNNTPPYGQRALDSGRAARGM
jgi:hypothetical protein